MLNFSNTSEIRKMSIPDNVDRNCLISSLQKDIEQLVYEANLEIITQKHIKKQLEQIYGMKLNEYKDIIYKLAVEYAKKRMGNVDNSIKQNANNDTIWNNEMDVIDLQNESNYYNDYSNMLGKRSIFEMNELTQNNDDDIPSAKRVKLELVNDDELNQNMINTFMNEMMNFSCVGNNSIPLELFQYINTMDMDNSNNIIHNLVNNEETNNIQNSDILHVSGFDAKISDNNKPVKDKNSKKQKKINGQTNKDKILAESTRKRKDKDKEKHVVYPLSREFQTILGRAYGSWQDVWDWTINYIDTHNLKDGNRKVNFDDTLQSIFNKDSTTFSGLSRMVWKHLQLSPIEMKDNISASNVLKALGVANLSVI